jgi:N-formylglutamate amidohydrolase
MAQVVTTRTSTPAPGSRALGADRSTALVKAAAEDEARGRLQSAETNLRLALAFAPHDQTIRRSLERVLAGREAERVRGAR